MNIEQRIKKIVTIDDIDEQLRLAKQYIQRLKSKARLADSLDAKLAINDKVKQAELTLRKLRRYSFDIEDALIDGKPALSAIAS